MFELSYTFEELDKITSDLNSFNHILKKYFDIDKFPTYNDYFKSYSNLELQNKYKHIYEIFYLIEYRINKLPIEVWNIIIKHYLYHYIYKLKIPLVQLNPLYHLALSLHTNNFKKHDRPVRKINNFVFLDLDTIPERNYDPIEVENLYFTDIGYRYCGMGHYVTLSYDKRHQKFFLKEEGGSNGYESDENHQISLRFKDHPKYEKHLMRFQDVLDKIQKETGRYLDEIPNLYYSTLNQLLK